MTKRRPMRMYFLSVASFQSVAHLAKRVSMQHTFEQFVGKQDD